MTALHGHLHQAQHQRARHRDDQRHRDQEQQQVHLVHLEAGKQGYLALRAASRLLQVWRAAGEGAKEEEAVGGATTWSGDKG
jgi:hypothetical protein